MRQRLYLDTSVVSALIDDRVPIRHEQTNRFWQGLALRSVVTSEVARLEIDLTPDEKRRRLMLAKLNDIRVFTLTNEMRILADRYVDAAVFTRRMENDALHVAAAVVEGCDVLVSWNFRHLVNRARRAAINAMNVQSGLPTIDVLAPPEV